MELLGLLVFGGLVGMQHALEADHLAAVASMSAERSSRRQLVLRGAWWGAGHTLALFLICGAVVLGGLTLSARAEAALEFCVGVMIVVLGANVLWSVARRRVHFHVHDHGGTRHVHAHSHADGEREHRHDGHDHVHPPPRFGRALAIGLMHGAAGSAGLLVLAAAAADSAWSALAYVAAFGIGSILGMAALSFVASWPLGALQRGAVWLNVGAQLAIGAVAILIGGMLIAESYVVL